LRGVVTECDRMIEPAVSDLGTNEL
jgi:hypothetical protein